MKERLLIGLTCAGLLFSGYLGGVKLFQGTCAFNESCPYFLGYPTCFWGFGMYLLIALLLVGYHTKKLDPIRALRGVLLVSILGIIFAGYYSIGELTLLLTGGVAQYFLGLPTCAYGLVMYVAICFVGLRMLREERRS